MFSRRLTQSILILAPIGLLPACFDSNSSKDEGPPPSRFSLAVTDAPIDDARHVVVEFTEVVLQPSDSDRIVIPMDEPVRVDLLALQGQKSQYLVMDEEIPPGDYDWVRLAVNASLDGNMDSYIELNTGAQLELVIPSGAESGLKLTQGFVMQEGGEADFTVDFDLRRSVVISNHTDVASAVLKPSLRITDTMFSGSIEGEVDPLLVSEHCVNPDVQYGAVYIFDHTVEPDDVAGDSQGPMMSTRVTYDDGSYRYEAGFVPAGTYNLVYTCDAHLDSPETNDELTFIQPGSAPVTVSLAENVVLDFDVGESDGVETPETEKPTEDIGQGNETPEETPDVDPTEPDAEEPAPQPEAPDTEPDGPDLTPELPDLDLPDLLPEAPEEEPAPDTPAQSPDSPEPVEPEPAEPDNADDANDTPEAQEPEPTQPEAPTTPAQPSPAPSPAPEQPAPAPTPPDQQPAPTPEPPNQEPEVEDPTPPSKGNNGNGGGKPDQPGRPEGVGQDRDEEDDDEDDDEDEDERDDDDEDDDSAGGGSLWDLIFGT